MSWVPSAELVGNAVVLTPLRVGDASELARAADDPAIFEWTGSAVTDDESARAYVDSALADERRAAFLQRDKRTRVCVGTTSYYRIDSVNRSLAIGYTWLTTSAHGTAVNPEAKLLLLTRAFDEMGAKRVEWHTDERNERSRAAIAKLGAQFEGLLRNHRRRPDGSWRTTALYAMTDDDWPAVAASLRARVDRLIGI